MTSVDFNNVKKAYFDLLDLIIKFRIKEPLGKLGLTHIPKTEIDNIRDLKFDTSISVLTKDGLIGKIEELKDVIIVDCLKTAEQMIAYKNSLIVETGWPSVEVSTTGDGPSLQYKMTRRNNSGKVEKLSIQEGSFLTFLLSDMNIEKSRKDIAVSQDITVAKVSNLKNSIKRKLEKLDFTEEETDEMMHTYKR